MGWRLPSVHELASLVDPISGTTPALPLGHPFNLLVSPLSYWSATTVAGNSTLARFLDFQAAALGATTKADSLLFWCVRSGMNADQY